MNTEKSNSKKVYLALGVLLAVLGFIVGAQFQLTPPSDSNLLPDPQVTGTDAATSLKEESVYAMNVVVSHVPFWEDTRAIWSKIDSNYNGVRTIFGGPKSTDAQKQIDEILTLISKGIDGLIVAPADSAALTPVIDKAVQEGIPVITYLVDSPKSNRMTYISSELETASYRAAQSLVDESFDSGKVIIVYAQAGNEEQEARRRGYERFVADHPELEIVGTVQDNYSEEEGAKKIKALLVRHPDIKYIFGSNSRSAIGAVTALKEFGAGPGQVKIIGWDSDIDVLDRIKDGWVQRSVFQKSSYMTNLMFSILQSTNKSHLYPHNRSFEENGVPAVPTEIVVPITLITPETVNGYYPKS
ncbi:MAG: substrate-binding domain-containing protein [Candidatus Thiodiazotropha endolucinida]